MTDTHPTPIGAALTARVKRMQAEHPPAPDEPERLAPPPPPARTRWDSVPTRFARARLEDLDHNEVATELAAWSTANPPGNLLLLGPVGAGKTHAAIAACRPHVDDGATIEYAPVIELLDRLDWRRPDSHQYLELCCSVDLLIIDDIGTERPNEWNGERLYAIVNRRWLELLPTVATTNLEPTGPDGLDQVLGERTFSRLVDSATALRLTGRDRRRNP